MDMIAAALPEGTLARAALLGAFDPRQLLDPTEPGYDGALAALAEMSTEQRLGEDWLWALTDDARRQGLARLPEPGPEREALLAAITLRPDDGLGLAMTEALAERPAKELQKYLRKSATATPDEAGAGRILRLFQALEILGDAGVTLPAWAAASDTLRNLQRAIVLERRQAASAAVLPGRFRGRLREMAALRLFAETGRLPDSRRSVVRRLARPDGAAPDPRAVPVLAVSGIGGTGKSALMEALRRLLERAPDVTLAAFDLDHAALRMGDRVALTQELLRQIGLAHPDLDGALAGLRRSIRNALGAAGSQGPNVEAGGSAVMAALSDLGALLGGYGRGGMPMVVLIDTFEEALVAGAERVRAIADWLSTVREQAAITALRVVIAGRSAEALARVETGGLGLLGAIPLDDLGTRAGRSMLRDQFRRLGVPHEGLVNGLIAAFGANPLALEILARFCRGKAKAEIEALIADDDPAARQGLNAEMRQKFLYTRILERISSPDLQKLANPGLVLRQITPRLIAEVLAGPCRLAQPVSEMRAKALFDSLAAQVWLVNPVPGAEAVLEHIPDLRRLMLPQVLEDPKAAEVAAAAADWYAAEARAGVAGAAWEAVYYRALTDPAALPGDPPELRALADHLGTAAADLPKRGQALLREASGKLLDLAEIDLLDGVARDRALKKRRVTQVSAGLEKTVIAEASGELRIDAAGTGVAVAVDAAEFGRLLEDIFKAGSEASGEAATAAPFDAEVAQSRFAAGAYDVLAPMAEASALALFEALASGQDEAGSRYTLHHPAYLCALSALVGEAPLPGPLASRLGDWLGRGDNAAALASGIARMPEALTAGDGPAVVALMVLKAAGLSPWVVLAAGQSLARPLAELERHMAATVPQWRAALALRAPDAAPAPVALPVLPLFDPEMVAAVAGGGAGWLSASDLPGPTLADYAGLLGRTGPARLSDLASIEQGLATTVVRLDPQHMAPGSLRRLLPGRRQELQAPLRGLLDRREPVPGLEAAVARIAAEVGWWPRELESRRFAGDPGLTAMITLIDVADRCGRLGQLVGNLAGAAGADSGFIHLARLAERFALVWSGLTVQAAAAPA